MLHGASYVSFASAGTRGLVYIGMLDAVDDHLGTEGYEAWRSTLKGAAGTSAGSVAALILLLGLDRDARRQTLEDMSDMRNVVRCPDLTLLLRNYGWEDGSAFKELVQRVLMRGGLSANSTLGDLKRLLRQDLVCVCTDLEATCTVTLSAASHPGMRVCDAVYASSCVPFVFVPPKVDGRMVADGCLTCWMPDVFPRDDTLFVTLETVATGGQGIRSWVDFLQSIVRCASRDEAPMGPRCHTITLPPSLATVAAFDVDQGTKTAEALYRSGYSSTLETLLSPRSLFEPAGRACKLYMTFAVTEETIPPLHRDGA